jgi:YbbR domain-containing protein
VDFIRKHVLHNLGLKTVSLIAAVLLWFAVTREPLAEVAISVPVEFHNSPEHLEISTETIPAVQVRVRGPVRDVRDLSASEVHAIIDLDEAKAGERTYDLNPKRIHVPDGIEVVQAVPSQMRLSFDARATRQIEVKPRVIGSFASGYRIEKVEASPAVITIVGPSKHVLGVEAAVTDPVDATGVVGSATFVTHAYVSDPLVRLSDPNPIHVTVFTQKNGPR